MTRTTTLLDALSSAKVFVDGDWVESKDQDAEGDVRLIQLADVGDGYYVNKSNRFLTSAAAKRLKCTFLEPGDVLIARMPDPLGRACIFPGDMKRAVTVVDVCIIRVDPVKMYAPWLVHCINSSINRNQIAGYITGTTRQRISRGNLGKIEITLPPLPEQRRIAAILDQADALRAKRREALAQLDNLTQSIFIEMFGDPVANSKGWPDTTTLGEVANIASGVTKGRNLTGKVTRTIPYLAVANVQDKSLSLSAVKEIEATEDEIERYLLKWNDLILTEGGDPDKLGRGTLWKNELPECIHQNHIFRVRVTSEAVTPLFLNWLVGSQRGKKFFLRSAKQTTGIASINMTQLRSFPLLLPPVELQRDFEKIAEGVAKQHIFQTASLSAIEALFASLQHRAFRGEL